MRTLFTLLWFYYDFTVIKFQVAIQTRLNVYRTQMSNTSDICVHAFV